ncbi:MAG: EpsI family protein [Candidatus Omnitrophica bacterium]|nr:EpsI family protein [Candidatus Omnitrophota bacterium]
MKHAGKQRAARPVALLLLAAAAALVWHGPPAAQAVSGASSPSIGATVPAQVGSWAGRALSVEDRAKALLETDDVVLMEYRHGDQPPVWLAFVAGFGNRAAFHPPELCYVGSHFEVMQRAPVILAVNGAAHRLMRLVVRQNRQHYEAWYWFTANKRVTSNYYQQQAWLMWDTIRGRPASGTLVRISTPLDDPRATHARLLDFVTAWEERAGS